MKIILDSKKINNMIKEYYKENYDLKSCYVNTEVSSIINKEAEVDLIHKGNFYYNILHKTIVTGKIYDDSGVSYDFIDTLSDESVKNIIDENLNELGSITDEIIFNYRNNNNIFSKDEFTLSFEEAVIEIREKNKGPVKTKSKKK